MTARLVLARNPVSYTAVERDAAAAATVRSYLPPRHQCVLGSAEETGLPSECASVVFGEAMLSMQPATTKTRIVKEAVRLLRLGGRYGIHELCLVPDDVDEQIRNAIQQELSPEIHVGVRPLTRLEWRELSTAEGLQVDAELARADASIGAAAARAGRRAVRRDAICLERRTKSAGAAARAGHAAQSSASTAIISRPSQSSAGNWRTNTREQDAYTCFADIATEVETPADGTLSRTVFQDERLKVVLFGFSCRTRVVRTHRLDACRHAFSRGEATVIARR